jgi:hypothetical protein
LGAYIAALMHACPLGFELGTFGMGVYIAAWLRKYLKHKRHGAAINK